MLSCCKIESEKNRIYGLIGYPLAHSRSQSYFNEKFAKEGISDSCYCNFPLQNIGELDKLISDNPGVRGFNVTAPYKEQVISRIERLDSVAAECRSVNCVKIVKGRLCGYNTDAIGIKVSLEKLLAGKNVSDALVLGTGGAARTVAYVLRNSGITPLLVSRTPGPGEISYGEIDSQILKRYGLIINATPVGMWPNWENAPELPYEMLKSEHYLLDLLYNPEQTVFLTRGYDAGAEVMNGLTMLYVQAEESWRIWNNNSL